MSIAFADPLHTGDEIVAQEMSRRVLIVDDEEMVRAFAAMVLEAEGYQVLQAGDASEAAYVWSRAEGHIDLLVADISLPGESGLELAKDLRALNPDLQIIFASGYEEGAVRGASGPGLQAIFLPKPYTVKSLLEAVKRALEAASSPGPR